MKVLTKPEADKAIKLSKELSYGNITKRFRSIPKIILPCNLCRLENLESLEKT